MAKAVKERVPDLVLGLHAPGMTPLLRTGLGGLAAELRAYAQEKGSTFPTAVDVAGATFSVEPTQVVCRWNDKDPAVVLDALFKHAFGLKDGMVYLPGAYGDHEPEEHVRSYLQDALKRTFLQHGKSTTKPEAPVTTVEVPAEQRATADAAAPARGKKASGKRKAKTRKIKLGAGQSLRQFEVDDKVCTFIKQEYEAYVHQNAVEDVVKAMKRGPQPLAGWAYPGAVPKHNGFASASEHVFSPTEALCALFALVGAISYRTAQGNMGALVLPQPSNLVEFARARSHMTPRKLEDIVVGGAGDAALLTQLALKADASAQQRGVRGWQVVVLRALPWATQQKSRSHILEVEDFPEERLDVYANLKNALPSQVKVFREGPAAGEADEGSDGANFFIATSSLRAFVAENLARGDRWYRGFSTATVPGRKRMLFLHYYRNNDNLGALFASEKDGLVAMLDDLDQQERAVVEAVHTALRQRLGRIAQDAVKLGDTARNNRFNREKERIRLSLAGARTQEQVRGALADLWAKAGRNTVLQENWALVLPLLRKDRWQLARDLGLVALASYRPKDKQEADIIAALESDTTAPENA